VTPTSGTARWARGGTVGLTATGLAMGGHAGGGGGTPSALPLLLLAALAVLGSVGLSGRRWGVGPLLGVLLSVQFAHHVAFGGHTGSPMTLARHQHGAAAHQVMTTHPLGWRMVGAHVLAALVTALVLRRGETWFWRLAALGSAPLRALWLLHLPLAVPSTPAPSRVARGAMFLQPRLLVLAQPRRGPPASLAV
jgi:hypothetical protein